MIEHRKVARIGESERKKVVFEGMARSGAAASSQPTDGLTLEQADVLYPRKSDVYTKAESDTRFAPAPIRHRQLTPATTWGPIPHPFGRPASVETIGPMGEEFDCSVVHSPSFDSVTINLGMALAGEAIIS